jgi:hypothetical protein
MNALLISPAPAGTWSNMNARHILPPYGIRIVPTYAPTVPLGDFHRHKCKWEGETCTMEADQECTHFCHPSAAQLCVVALVRELRSAQLPLSLSPHHDKAQLHMRYGSSQMKAAAAAAFGVVGMLLFAVSAAGAWLYYYMSAGPGASSLTEAQNGGRHGHGE